jgi:ERF superfamily protein
MTETAQLPIDAIDPVVPSKPEKRRRAHNANGSKELAVQSEAPAPAPVSEGDAFTALFERLARDPSVDPARIQQFLDMKTGEEDRRARHAFLAAFAKLQAELPAVERKGTGHNSKKYARFEDFIQTVKPHLAAHGFSLSFRLQSEQGTIRIIGVLGHEAGHQETTDLPLPADTTGNKNNVQAWGSTISYGKRYVGMTLLGIATEDEDDDGKAAGNTKPVERITEKQAKDLEALAKRADVDLQIIYDRFNVTALTDLTPADAKLATNRCNSKLRLMEGKA